MNDKKLDLILKKLSEHDKRFSTIDKRFNVMDDRFDAMDKRFDAMDERFDAMDKRFDAMDIRMDEMDKRFDAVDVRIDAIDSRMDKFNQRIGRLEYAFIDQTGKFAEFEARIESKFEQRFQDIEGKIDWLMGTMSEVQNELLIIATATQRDLQNHETRILKLEAAI